MRQLAFSLALALSIPVWALDNFHETYDSEKLTKFKSACSQNYTDYRDKDIQKLFDALLMVMASKNCPDIQSIVVVEEMRSRAISTCPLVTIGELTDISLGTAKFKMQDKRIIDLRWDTDHLAPMDIDKYLYNGTTSAEPFLKQLQDKGVCQNIDLTKKAIKPSDWFFTKTPIALDLGGGCGVCYASAAFKGPKYSEICGKYPDCEAQMTAPATFKNGGMTCPQSYEDYAKDEITVSSSVTDDISKLPYYKQQSGHPDAGHLIGWASSNKNFPPGMPFYPVSSVGYRSDNSAGRCAGKSACLGTVVIKTNRGDMFDLVACKGNGASCYDAATCQRNQMKVWDSLDQTQSLSPSSNGATDKVKGQ